MKTEPSDIIWRPTPEVAERSRIGRFMRAHGVATLGELQRRSIADPDGTGRRWNGIWESGGRRRTRKCWTDPAVSRGPAGFRAAA